MSVVYGCDPGLKNCAFVKLVLMENKFSIESIDLIDISRNIQNFRNYYRMNMLEEGDVYIEYQYSHGKTKDMSHHIHGYLTAMMPSIRVHLKQSRSKFDVAAELKLMPENPGDLKVYKNRKVCSEFILKQILDKLGDKNTSHLDLNMKKKDDVADALLYALWAAKDRDPNVLKCIGQDDIVEKMKPLKEEKRIHISI